MSCGFESHFSYRKMIDNAPNCHVATSPIHGHGLFSSVIFEKGDIVVDYSMHLGIWKTIQFKDLTEEEIERCWWIGLDNFFCQVPTEDHKFFFANHSDSPNCRWDRVRRKLIANQLIGVNTEITYNYKEEISPKWLKKPSWIMAA